MTAPQTVTATVTAHRWDDEVCPTVEPATLSARAAAIALLEDIDWADALDHVSVEVLDLDPLVFAGLVAELGSIDFRRAARSRFQGRPSSHLATWVTARLRRHEWCVAHVDHYEDCIPFDDCTADSDEPHMWSTVWALHGHPADFVRLACHLLRDGWEPEATR